MSAIRRVGVELNPKFHPAGHRFFVQKLPEGRRVADLEELSLLGGCSTPSVAGIGVGVFTGWWRGVEAAGEPFEFSASDSAAAANVDGSERPVLDERVHGGATEAQQPGGFFDAVEKLSVAGRCGCGCRGIGAGCQLVVHRVLLKVERRIGRAVGPRCVLSSVPGHGQPPVVAGSFTHYMRTPRWFGTALGVDSERPAPESELGDLSASGGGRRGGCGAAAHRRRRGRRR